MIILGCDFLWADGQFPSFWHLTEEEATEVLSFKRRGTWRTYALDPNQSDSIIEHMTIVRTSSESYLRATNGTLSDLHACLRFGIQTQATFVCFIRLHRYHLQNVCSLVANADDVLRDLNEKETSKLHFICGCMAILLGDINVEKMPHSGILKSDSSTCWQSCICLRVNFKEKISSQVKLYFLTAYCVLTDHYENRNKINLTLYAFSITDLDILPKIALQQILKSTTENLARKSFLVLPYIKKRRSHVASRRNDHKHNYADQSFERRRRSDEFDAQMRSNDHVDCYGGTRR